MTKIFLSYGRGDDEPFAARLNERLTAAEFAVWFDRVTMPSRALTFLQEIRDAIHESDRLVIVLGPHAAASDYVRAEWQYALADEKIVVPVLRLGDFDLVPAELKDFHCEDCRAAKDEHASVARVIQILREPAAVPGPVFGNVPAPPPCFQPRPDEMTNLAGTVLEELRKAVVLTPTERITLIYGMGGVGKSVMAAAFARSMGTRRAFPEGVCWSGMRQDTTGVEALRQITALLPGGAVHNVRDEADGAGTLRELLAGKRLLLVLDNVWTMSPLTAILPALDPNTRVLVTARDRGLGLGTGARKLGLGTVSEETALRHLADWAGARVEDLAEPARELARECGYLPFALALNGAMLRDGSTWEDLLEAIRSARLDYAEQEFADYPEYRNVARSIEVSIEALGRQSEAAAERFRDLAVFLAKQAIPEPAIRSFWRYRGVRDDLDVRKLLLTLDRKTLVRLEGEAPNRRVLLHDLVRDHIRATAPDRAALNSALLDSYRAASAGGWPAGPCDGYFHQYLIGHLLAGEDTEEVERLLSLETEGGTNAWYEVNEGAGNRPGYAEDLECAARLGKPADDDCQQWGQFLWRQLRYGAMLVSINSLAANLPTPLRTALLRTRLWIGEQALADASRIPEPEKRVSAINDLLPYLGEPEKGHAIETALAAARSRANLSMANCQIGLNAVVLEVLIPLPGCATSSSCSFI